jgi:hypothetical protein
MADRASALDHIEQQRRIKAESFRQCKSGSLEIARDRVPHRSSCPEYRDSLFLGHYTLLEYQCSLSAGVDNTRALSLTLGRSLRRRTLERIGAVVRLAGCQRYDAGVAAGGLASGVAGNASVRFPGVLIASSSSISVNAAA